ncbi:MAG: alpha-ketoglutarate-dependent dioxygenase AlkB, partial [Micromonosporaceae bacterium]|nr:alpha-ketoglutarate-dependent dioxygenase AlkB [Micromonosporaceae bacterium]
MSADLQGSLFDLGSDDGPRLGDLAGLRRTELPRGAWIDVLPGWLAGSDALFARLVDTVPWRAERRAMYERTVDVPRLLSWYDETDELPDPALARARDALTE